MVGKYCVFPEEFEAVALPIFDKVCMKQSDKYVLKVHIPTKVMLIRSVIYWSSMKSEKWSCLAQISRMQ